MAASKLKPRMTLQEVLRTEGIINKQRLWWYIPAMMLTVVVIALMVRSYSHGVFVYVGSDSLDNAFTPMGNVEWSKHSIYTYREYVKLSNRVVKDYSDLIDKATSSASSNNNSTMRKEFYEIPRNCMEWFTNNLFANITEVKYTDPTFARKVLEFFHLDNYAPANTIVDDLINEPIDATFIVNNILACGKRNRALYAWACEAEMFGYSINSSENVNAVHVVTYMAVLSRIAAESTRSHTFAEDVVYHIREEIVSKHKYSIYREEYDDANRIVELYAHMRRRSDQSVDSVAIRTRNTRLERGIQVSLLSSVYTQETHTPTNSMVGLSLAHYLTHRGQTITVDTDEGQSLYWPVGIPWAQDAISWDLNVVLERSGEAIATLLSPTTMCVNSNAAYDTVTRPSSSARDFITLSGYASYFTIAGLYTSSNILNFTTNTQPSYTANFGTSNLRNMQTRVTKEGDIDSMRRRFPVDTTSGFKFSSLDSWRMIRAVLLFGSVLLLGWGSEIVTTLWLLKQPEEEMDVHEGVFFVNWHTHSKQEKQQQGEQKAQRKVSSSSTKEEEVSQYRLMGVWRLAQLAFPLCLSIAILSESVFGLPFLIIGLWKFGFPETVSNLILCMRTRACGETITNLDAIPKFCNGFGTLLHHSAAAWYAVVIITRIYTPYMYPLEYFSFSLPLIVQHWFTILKYVNTMLYGIVEISLEIWFEIEAFSSLTKLQYWHEICVLCTMIVAHWLYWIAAFLSLYLTFKKASTTDDIRRDSVALFKDAANKRSLDYYVDLDDKRPASPSASPYNECEV
eukprot:m.13436 g.13436  ORF g.13436 m.13436 type:complete len:793 (+) comp4853_c0_seq1:200-2578(+)